MMDVRTRYVAAVDLPLTTPVAMAWLSSDERAVCEAMRSSERRRSWQAGRIVAKQLLRQVLGEQNHPRATATPDRIHVESRSPRAGHGERPVVFIDDRPLPCAISIAHTRRGVLAAACLGEEVAVGVDLVASDTDAGRLAWTLTDAERGWLASSGSAGGRVERLWAMKEALYKACQRSEGFAPRRIEVVPGQTPRYPQLDVARELATLQCWRVDAQYAALAVIRNNPAKQTSFNSPAQLTLLKS